MTQPVVWIDGVLVPEAEARVSAFDHGLMVGDGVFETLRVVGGQAIAIRRHLERLGRSATGLMLRVPSPDVLRQAIEDVVVAQRIDEGRVRITITGGPSPLGSVRGASSPTAIVAAAPQAPWPETTDVVVAPWPRNERGALVGLKTVSYAENVLAVTYANSRGAGEALFGNLAGNLCEGTATNVFYGLAGRLTTPPLSAGCLAGVTRDLVMEVVEVVEEDLPLSAVTGVEEMFLTSSTRDVQAVRAVDGHVLPSAPGPLTSAAATAFADLVRRIPDP